jgi:hypothetical protein
MSPRPSCLARIFRTSAYGRCSTTLRRRSGRGPACPSRLGDQRARLVAKRRVNRRGGSVGGGTGIRKHYAPRERVHDGRVTRASEWTARDNRRSGHQPSGRSRPCESRGSRRCAPSRSEDTAGQAFERGTADPMWTSDAVRCKPCSDWHRYNFRDSLTSSAKIANRVVFCRRDAGARYQRCLRSPIRG